MAQTRYSPSATFQRGDTQNIAITTLGPTKEAQDMDGLTGGATSKSFILHYNFPPFSVGEAGRFIGPGRREIGHGALAERSLVPVLPPEDVFPYSIRVVSEIMASNGSTSMASICGGCLALMDAGVPIIAPVAGISCGLMTEMAADGSITKWTTITDILGEEDHFGDMDFKLAGTTKGITGFQLDLKINGLPFEIAKTAILQARDARIEILKTMLAALPAPRKDLSAYAPRIQTIQIDPEKIGLLIGPGGKTIRRITETTGAQIDIAVLAANAGDVTSTTKGLSRTTPPLKSVASSTVRVTSLMVSGPVTLKRSSAVRCTRRSSPWRRRSHAERCRQPARPAHRRDHGSKRMLFARCRARP